MLSHVYSLRKVFVWVGGVLLSEIALAELVLKENFNFSLPEAGGGAIAVARVVESSHGTLDPTNLTVETSHRECEAWIAGDTPDQLSLMVRQLPRERNLQSCIVSVETRSQPLQLRLLTVPLAGSSDNSLDVRFTNPLCGPHPYLGYFESSNDIARGDDFEPLNFLTDERGIPLRDGTWRQNTPPGFCIWSDNELSRKQTGSPFNKLVSWIDDTQAGDRIFFTTFTFSDREIRETLCAAARRGVKVEFVVGTESSHALGLRDDCGATYHKGFTSGGDSRLNHAKYFTIERAGSEQVRVVFQSANVSASGLSIHHENWGFAQQSRDSQFVRDHLCYRDSLISSHFNRMSAQILKDEVEKCRFDSANAATSLAEAIETFLIPGERGAMQEGDVMTNAILNELKIASSVDIAAHHFLNTARNNPSPENDVREALLARLESDETFSVRMLIDDELFWVGSSPLPDHDGTYAYDHYPATARRMAGPGGFGASFSFREYGGIRDLVRSGMEIRYMETNHMGKRMQHNKFVIFHHRDGTKSVFTGAGNMSKSAFHSNGENYYLIRDEALTQAWVFEYNALWEGFASAPESLPLTWAFQVEGFTSWNAWRSAIEATKTRGN